MKKIALDEIFRPYLFVGLGLSFEGLGDIGIPHLVFQIKGDWVRRLDLEVMICGSYAFLV